jgi:hypothetical protein
MVGTATRIPITMVMPKEACADLAGGALYPCLNLVPLIPRPRFAAEEPVDENELHSGEHHTDSPPDETHCQAACLGYGDTGVSSSKLAVFRELGRVQPARHRRKLSSEDLGKAREYELEKYKLFSRCPGSCPPATLYRHKAAGSLR